MSAGARMLAKSAGAYKGVAASRFFRTQERAALTLGGLFTGYYLTKSAVSPLGKYARQAYNDAFGGTEYVREEQNRNWIGTKTPLLENQAPLGATGGLTLAAHRNRIRS